MIKVSPAGGFVPRDPPDPSAPKKRRSPAVSRGTLFPPDDGLVVCPFTVLHDTREQAPWTFSGIAADARQHNRQIAVQVRPATLTTGDYTIEGYEQKLAIERKSLEDLYGTLGAGRERFEAEHYRMAEIVRAGGFCCVIVESSLQQALLEPPLWSNLNPKTIDRTRLSWGIKFGVPWLFEQDRRRAEVTAFRIMEKFVEQQETPW